MTVVRSDAARRCVILSGTVAQFNIAFNVELKHYQYSGSERGGKKRQGGTYRGRIGAITVPSDLVDVIEGVFGLDNRPQARQHLSPREDQGMTRMARSFL